jgi:hypothetical protein
MRLRNPHWRIYSYGNAVSIKITFYRFRTDFLQNPARSTRKEIFLENARDWSPYVREKKRTSGGVFLELFLSHEGGSLERVPEKIFTR